MSVWKSVRCAQSHTVLGEEGDLGLVCGGIERGGVVVTFGQCFSLVEKGFFYFVSRSGAVMEQART